MPTSCRPLLAPALLLATLSCSGSHEPTLAPAGKVDEGVDATMPGNSDAEIGFEDAAVSRPDTALDGSDAAEPVADTGPGNPDAAEPAADADTSPDATPQVRPLTVHFHEPDFHAAYVHYDLDGQGWTPVPGMAMRSDGGGWWSHTTPPGHDLELLFDDDGASWYPGGATNNFRTSWPDSWFADGLLYTASPEGPRPADELVVMTLNLHSYQETDAAAKLDRIADLIARLRPDFVCFQECAQAPDTAPVADPRATVLGPAVIREDNMAHRISTRLHDVHGLTYAYAWAWAHHAWNYWEEGLAVLSAHPVLEADSRYLSNVTSTSDINSRRAVFLAAQVPGLGRLHVFSVHTSWGSAQPGQIASVKSYVSEREIAGPTASLVCGDFNANAGEAGYQQLVGPEGGRLFDSYFLANPRGFADPTMAGDGTRIDYIFWKEGAPVTARTSQIFFKDTPPLGGLVSDHFAVISRLGFTP